ncbi:hypothetical protein [Niveibacterium sp. SC-1]|uniref:hypothetical protein n=1 Tax=Niveibacterium sp. SC-1 TaxID=3135646 RepID=UPI00311EA050
MKTPTLVVLVASAVFTQTTWAAEAPAATDNQPAKAASSAQHHHGMDHGAFDKMPAADKPAPTTAKAQPKHVHHKERTER